MKVSHGPSDLVRIIEDLFNVSDGILVMRKGLGPPWSLMSVVRFMVVHLSFSPNK